MTGIDFKTVEDTVKLVSKMLKADKLNKQVQETKNGITVGDFTILNDGESYAVYHRGGLIKDRLSQLSSAITIIELHVKNRMADMVEVIRADMELFKQKNDIAHFEYIAEVTTNSETKAVAMDRRDIAVYRLKMAKQAIGSIRLVNKLMKIDK